MHLPPYGAPPREIGIIDDGARPGDWPAGEDWDAFYSAFVDDVSAHIWPKWDPSSGSGPWVGAAATFAAASTRRELEIAVQRLQIPKVIEDKPKTTDPNGALLQRDHYWHYALEDFVGSFIDNLQVQYPDGTEEQKELERTVAAFPTRNIYYYDSQIELQDVKGVFSRMFVRKYNGIFQTKLVFRRPRPQQAAFILGVERFEHRQAQSNVHTGNHPALISGHCAQGLLFVCTLIDEQLERGRSLSSIPLDAYAQYAVDFGDRRVLAGVHYTTDNLSSWIAVLRLIPLVFEKRGPFLAEFIANAIKDRSLVYDIIEAPFAAPNSPYPGAWALLQEELQTATGLGGA